ncbi:sensor domain-containing diguanylate cyclase [Lederbergia citrea]|uniref:Sensor domain-containing diguanylate cyclase n=1 Tax=Lederbergia citrea TaxID=2833581 RepID=A0A942Z2Q1_9BACI|nr:sensor domain-containing diguanylate cyclase [Lederbergia citrea]MBS4176010.1 sensor domain-containing diguanylate cyclase [Lederbergia citrea]MBS4202571.1 sensor domain-containing diguanylate cyclase [Lederbergia citrea]MBS4222763.1 sensor domain-containing diguanylate cyclase [Lederbergia citrea]
MKINRANPMLKFKSVEEMKYRELYRVTEKFHSTMDINSVLAEIIQTLKKVFPKYDYYLLLSNDHDASPELPIKGLEYNSENDSAITAYVNGAVELVHSEYPMMYAPLKGKQGVYGVLQVQSHLPTPLKNSQIEFIRLLANTAGSALENAKLYQQSQKLIEDLRLIDETSQKLNSTSSLCETIEYLHKQITKLFRPSEIGFIFLGENDLEILEASSSYFHKQDGLNLINTTIKKLKDNQESLFIGEIKHMPECAKHAYGSLMAIPMIHGESIKGIAIVLGDKPYSFTFEMFKLFQSLIQRSTLAVTNSMLREKLEKMVITDQLTQLYARNYLNTAIKTSMKRDREGTFILIDLDDFKTINDTYGHQVGDEVLIQVADLVRSSLRETDIGARWGGEELAIYLPGVPLDNGVHIAERLLNHVSLNTEPAVTISCGISNWFYGKEDEVKQLFYRADTALYKAKHAGKNQIAVKPLDSAKI